MEFNLLLKKGFSLVEPRPFAEGTFAEVYVGISPSGERVAVKIMRKVLLRAKRLLKRVRSEIETHAICRFPAVVSLYNFFEDDDYIYIILELCEGLNGPIDLYGLLKAGKMTEGQARSTMDSLLAAVEYLHDQGVVHRDIKASNLLIHDTSNDDKENRDGNSKCATKYSVKLADFGLAIRLQRPDEKRFTICGTPNYLAPEVLFGNAHGRARDMWSIGCVLYTMLVGIPPFEAHHPRETMERIRQMDFEVPGALSAEARDLVVKLLSPDPEDRISVKEALNHPFMDKKLRREKLEVEQGIEKEQIAGSVNTSACVEAELDELFDGAEDKNCNLVEKCLQSPGGVLVSPKRVIAVRDVPLHVKEEESQPSPRPPLQATPLKRCQNISKSLNEETIFKLLKNFLDTDSNVNTKCRISPLSTRRLPASISIDALCDVPATVPVENCENQFQLGSVHLLSSGSIIVEISFHENRNIGIEISSNGMRIILGTIQSKCGKVCGIQKAFFRFLLRDLPHLLRPAYDRASACIDCLRAQTAKVSFHAPGWSAVLMENRDLVVTYQECSHSCNRVSSVRLSLLDPDRAATIWMNSKNGKEKFPVYLRAIDSIGLSSQFNEDEIDVVTLALQKAQNLQQLCLLEERNVISSGASFPCKRDVEENVALQPPPSPHHSKVSTGTSPRESCAREKREVSCNPSTPLSRIMCKYLSNADHASSCTSSQSFCTAVSLASSVRTSATSPWRVSIPSSCTSEDSSLVSSSSRCTDSCSEVTSSTVSMDTNNTISFESINLSDASFAKYLICEEEEEGEEVSEGIENIYVDDEESFIIIEEAPQCDLSSFSGNEECLKTGAARLAHRWPLLCSGEVAVPSELIVAASKALDRIGQGNEYEKKQREETDVPLSVLSSKKESTGDVTIEFSDGSSISMKGDTVKAGGKQYLMGQKDERPPRPILIRLALAAQANAFN
eukprot:g2433.t1